MSRAEQGIDIDPDSIQESNKQNPKRKGVVSRRRVLQLMVATAGAVALRAGVTGVPDQTAHAAPQTPATLKREEDPLDVEIGKPFKLFSVENFIEDRDLRSISDVSVDSEGGIAVGKVVDNNGSNYIVAQGVDGGTNPLGKSILIPTKGTVKSPDIIGKRLVMAVEPIPSNSDLASRQRASQFAPDNDGYQDAYFSLLQSGNFKVARNGQVIAPGSINPVYSPDGGEFDQRNHKMIVKDGNVIVVWSQWQEETNPLDQRLYAAKILPDGTVMNPGLVGGKDGIQKLQGLVVSPDGKVHVDFLSSQKLGYPEYQVSTAVLNINGDTLQLEDEESLTHMDGVEFEAVSTYVDPNTGKVYRAVEIGEPETGSRKRHIGVITPEKRILMPYRDQTTKQYHPSITAARLGQFIIGLSEWDPKAPQGQLENVRATVFDPEKEQFSDLIDVASGPRNQTKPTVVRGPIAGSVQVLWEGNLPGQSDSGPSRVFVTPIQIGQN